MTSKSSSWRQKYDIRSTKLSWCQNTSWRRTIWHDDKKVSSDIKKHVMTSKDTSFRQNVRHDVNKHVMTSKIRHDVRDTSWRQKVRNDVKNTLWLQKKSSWRQQIRHDVKNMWNVCYDVKDIAMTSKSMPWHKRYVMASQIASWRYKLSVLS